ncbi:uncharacterized protein ACBR49_004543 [Aulostomus maculatus]
METVRVNEEGEPAKTSSELHRSNQTPADVQPVQHSSWSKTLKALGPCRTWSSLIPVAVVWSVCQVEAPLPDASWRFVLVCLLWMLLGGFVFALRSFLKPGKKPLKETPPQRVPQEVLAMNKMETHASMSRSRDLHASLALALADGLLLCVLQEPLSDPSMPHIQELHSRLQSVAHTLEGADTGSAEDQDSELTDKVMLIHSYLQRRMKSLHRLIQVQGDFEASVKDVLKGLDERWAQLEELHTGVTLTKEGSPGHTDLASAHADAATLFTALTHYKSRLQGCQAHLKDSTQLLQELTWSHTHLCSSVSSSSESVWPELLLQSNIEQFDKVQENFLSLEQQTCTFQAHLQGLGKNQDMWPLAPANRASSQTSQSLPGDVSPEHRNSISASSSASSVDADMEKDTQSSLCNRSMLRFSSTIGRLRKSGRKK